MPDTWAELKGEIGFGAQDLPGPAGPSIPVAAHDMSGLTQGEWLMLQEMLAKLPEMKFEVGDEIVLMSDGEIDPTSPEAALILDAMRRKLLGG